MNIDHPDAPKIEFPLEYPIKVIGDNADSFAQDVSEVVQQHDPKFDPSCIQMIPSRKATFVSLRMNIWATGEEQLGNLHKALTALPSVKMVL